MRSIAIPALLAGLLSSFCVAPAYAQASAAAPEPAQVASNDPPSSAEPTGAPETAAQPPASAAPATDAAPAASPTAAPGASGPCCTLVDGTFLDLEIAEPLSSKTAMRGQRFKLRLAKPASVDGVVVLPAGLEGVGEVIHAARARGGGKPGELLVAARFLNGPDRQIPLRGLKLGGRGQDTTTTALGVAIALGPVGFFVRGGEIEIPVGAAANAKLAGTQSFAPSAPPATTTVAPAVAETVPQMDANATPGAAAGKDVPTP